MKVLQIFQDSLSFVVNRGTDEKKTPFQKCLRIFNDIRVGFIYGFGLLSLFLFLLIEAKTFQEYAEVIYPLVTVFVNSCIILIYKSKKCQIFAMIDGLEDIINIRE